MKVFLLKNIAKVGLAGEIIKVEDGYARNYLFPRNLAVEITSANEGFYLKKVKSFEHRKEAIETETSLLAEKIKELAVTIKRKMHDDGKLYGAISQADIVDILAQKGVNVSKSQVLIDKSIKSKGKFEVTIKLSSRLQPTLTLNVISE
jgi:large subunit ribosomal protein L9